jgi:hypothetical protein
MKDVAAKRFRMVNQQHAAKLIELDLIEMRESVRYLMIAGQNTVCEKPRKNEAEPKGADYTISAKKGQYWCSKLAAGLYRMSAAAGSHPLLKMQGSATG